MKELYFEIYGENLSQIYAEDIPYFPSSDLWGHLGNKFLFILQRLEYLNNNTLKSIYVEVGLYNSKLKKREYISNDIHIKPYIEIIHLVGDLRMIIDELISLLYILEKRESNGDYPNKIKISSIGEMLKEFEKESSQNLTFFKPYKNFLENINAISNSYKHSFINSDTVFYRQLNEPIVYAGKNDFNQFDKERKLIAIPLKEIVREFNELFKNYRILIKSKTTPQKQGGSPQLKNQ